MAKYGGIYSPPLVERAAVNRQLAQPVRTLGDYQSTGLSPSGTDYFSSIQVEQPLVGALASGGGATTSPAQRAAATLQKSIGAISDLAGVSMEDVIAQGARTPKRKARRV